MPAPDNQIFSDARVVSGILVTAGLISALTIGTMIGSDDPLYLILGIGVASLMAALVVMQTNIWILIPMFWYLTGRLGFAPLPISLRDVMVLVAFGGFVVLFAMRAVRGHVKPEFLDWLVFLNVGYLVTVFARNPAGVSALGSHVVGGRPYFDSLIGFLAFTVLSRVTLGPRLARILPVLFCVPQVGISLLGTFTHFFPSTAPAINRIYAGLDASEYLRAAEPEERSRIMDLFPGAKAGITTLVSYFAPITLLSPLHPMRFLCFLAVCAGFALSGFRSGIVYLVGVFLLAAYFRNGIKQTLIVMTAIALGVLGLVSVQNSGLSLPLTAQRALSFLPGNWDKSAVSDAEGSSEWRYYMWDIVLKTDTYIHNKLLGDGFGFSDYELQIMEQQQEGGTGFIGAAEQEAFLIQGAFHSGPLSAIRFVGGVGLFLYMALLVAAALYGWKTIQRSKQTDYFPVALLFGIPAIYEPFQYVLIFGGFDSGFPTTLFVCGMLKLISREVDQTVQVRESKLVRAIPLVDARSTN
jgi:hypothetical protein